MTTVYVLTTGTYSDYQIRGIFSTKEKAEQARKFYIYTNEIMKWELDKIEDLFLKGLKVYYVSMNMNGDEVYAEQTNPEMEDWKNTNFIINRVRPWRCICYTWAKSEAAAIKICNEKRLEYLAKRSTRRLES